MAEAKPKAVNYLLIPEEDNPAPYRVLRDIRDLHHGDTRQARIALAWRLRTKEDGDGHLELGRCIKLSDLHKEYVEYDFIITLNREVWNAVDFSDKQRAALIDHEMMHVAPAYDKDGNQKYDERNRPVFRIRHHDIQEFIGIVERHGCYKRDLEMLGRAIMDKHRAPLLVTNDEPINVPVRIVPLRDEDEGQMPYPDPPVIEGQRKKSGPEDLAAYHAEVVQEEIRTGVRGRPRKSVDPLSVN